MSTVLSKMKTRTPNCSAFPFDFRNKFSSRIGELTPVACIEMGPNDRLKMSLAQLTRMLPLSAPAMANFQLHVDSVFVPARIVAKKYEKFFNAGTADADRPYFPALTLAQYTGILINSVGAFNKSLLDYLGYPTFENVKDFYRNMITTLWYADSDGQFRHLWYTPDMVIPNDTDEWSKLFYDLRDPYKDFSVFAEDGTFVASYVEAAFTPTVQENSVFYLANANTALPNFLSWLVCTRMGLTVNTGTALTNFPAFLAKYGISLNREFAITDVATVADVVEKYLNHENMHMNTLVDEYFSFAVRWFNDSIAKRFESGVYNLMSYIQFEQLIYCKDDSDSHLPSLRLREHKISLLPIFSFWKSYFDWYVNSILEHGEDLTDAWSGWVNAIIGNGNPYGSILELDFTEISDDASILEEFFGNSIPGESIFYLPSRLWAIDRFTGAYNDTQNGQVVRIPTEGTIRDLKASNVLQRYLEKALFGGTRTIDKNELIYGAHSSNQLLDRTEVLSRKKFSIDIQQVTNTAASESFDLGTLAGNGFGMGGNFLFDYTCEERGYVMIFASVVLPPSYVQALDRNLLHTGYYDFVIPDFDTIGEQEILPEELYFDKGMNLTSGMYNRRYYEAIDFLSSVHGDFKNTLRHWHDARFFKNAPSLSPEFIRIDPENDDLERIFATYSNDQLLHFFAFSGVVVRPMSKFVTFGAI